MSLAALALYKVVACGQSPLNRWLMMQTQTAGLQKRVGDLEQEVKKLSGQQNLQQRIHHHAKIKVRGVRGCAR